MALEPQQDRKNRAMLAVGPLPDGLDCLIRIVALGEWRCAETEEAYRRHGADFIRNASATFLIKVLFASSHDPYRTLGLTPSASAQQVQEHKRLLLRWLHPDVNSNTLERRYITQVVDAAAAIKSGWRQTAARRTTNRRPLPQNNPPGANKVRAPKATALILEQPLRPQLRKGVRWLSRSFMRLLKVSLVALVCLLGWTFIVGEPIGDSIIRYARSATALVPW